MFPSWDAGSAAQESQTRGQCTSGLLVWKTLGVFWASPQLNAVTHNHAAQHRFRRRNLGEGSELEPGSSLQCWGNVFTNVSHLCFVFEDLKIKFERESRKSRVKNNSRAILSVREFPSPPCRPPPSLLPFCRHITVSSGYWFALPEELTCSA